MSKKFNIMNETKARIGSGSGLYKQDPNDGLYALLCPLIKIPFIKEDVSEVEIKVATGDTITKINGVATLSSSEAEIYVHRDIIRLLEKYNGNTYPLISMLGDMTGYKYNATITYSVSEAELENPVTGTLKITPVTEPEYIDDCYPLLKPTAHFASAIPGSIGLESTTGTYVQTIEAKPKNATFSATVSDSTKATATVENNKLTITGVAAGSCVVTLKTVLEGYASWETTIHVIIPEASVSAEEGE